MKLSGLLTILTIIVIGKACPNADSNCLRCYGTYCLICVGGYTNQNGQCVRSTNQIPDCISYSANGVCSQCQLGKSLSADGSSCNAISVPNCVMIDVNNKCAACNGTIFPVNNQCLSENKCNLDNCAICQYKYDRQVCLYCKPGFSIYTYNNYYTTCIPQYPAISNCRLTDYQDNSKCRECNVGYSFNSSHCSASPNQAVTSYPLSASKMSLFVAGLMLLLVGKF